jgi:hypothetical protein
LTGSGMGYRELAGSDSLHGEWDVPHWPLMLEVGEFVEAKRFFQ